ncbi:alanine acetyltransferase [Alkalihalobacillus alcalophilus ATCC 27647 = CGMCC 1.3604]|uniref:Alanine acetyltransferase n=1 Tax=Alkalihalobacillus alcalophilus ATCC 27647 = CGMCC 1.3604 TaxID=1218173 RepID=A0A094YXY0_ALKAL|nr:GNAT family protein [Alkalihalobacillus alcalophilus]KGA98392.1 alanine acetyltransferase [Alkalihalobacillus alcalophilus ATCC 27647 = CGMCC 1.3604]MED1563928.1 GNAT family protein [Alkalihalobacillus alcalophilus]THG91585.1 alanine acetyltransferase [Alkalihalobacillus alcalophilus ATCC 27647 = CGMCC 1.3604]
MINRLPVLETERLILREVVESDAKDLLSYLSKEEVVKHMGLTPFKTIDDALEEIGWYHSILENKSGMRWGITLKEEGKVIGSCGFLNRSHKHYRAEIGFELSNNHWGKGLAGEALVQVVQYGFEQLEFERIEALIEPANLASQKLVEKHGFIREGLLRNYEFTAGKFDDLYMYSMIKADFLNLHRKVEEG